jgi:hypothetical protein
MKTYPANWTTPQLAFFAGLLSGHISIGELKKIIFRVRQMSSNGDVYYTLLVDQLKPVISSSRWCGIVENCERLFA